MGILNFIKGQFIDVIEYQTDDKRILAHRFDDGGKQIMMGAKLTVRPGQLAVFVNEGQIADVFKEGFYELTTNNMPILTVLKSWKYGFESPFKVDIYFIMIDDKIQQPWGTPNKIAIKDQDFGIIRIGANGYYNYRVAKADLFIKKLVATDSEFTVDECRPQLNGKLATAFSDIFATSKVKFFDAYENLQEFSELVKKESAIAFDDFGLELVDFNLVEFKIPDEVEKAMDSRASIGAMGGMDLYQRKTMVDAIGQATVKMAENEGGAGVGPMGMQMGAGVAMGGMMAQMMQGTQTVQQVQTQQANGESMVACPKCHAQVAASTKFCPYCGLSMVIENKTSACTECGAPIKEGAKFCSECGKEQIKKSFCIECGKELANGAKFCPDCGAAQIK